MPVEWTDDPTAFVTRDWTILAESDPGSTFFHTPSYLKLYWEEFGATGLQIAFVREGSETVAVAALDIAGGAATFLGGFEITDYMGPVGLAEARKRSAKELMAALARRDDWEEADLRGLPDDNAWIPALRDGARDAGLAVTVGDDGVAPLLPLPGSFDAYLAQLSGKLRHEVRRKIRRLEEALPSVRLVDATIATLATDFGSFVELHRSSTGEKGKFMHPGMELFFRRLGDALLPEGVFRLTFLEADGEKLAAAVGFRDRRRFLLYNSAYDHARSALAPGIVLIAWLIQDLIEAGGEELDMMKHEEQYKYRLGARRRRVRRLLLQR
jgi:CelD/BcsL family acetyltransferase involved in cellulose biosynthesis